MRKPNPNAALIDSLGSRPMVAERLGVTHQAVINACNSDRLLSASWFDLLEKLGLEVGIDVPRSAFAFRTEGEAA